MIRLSDATVLAYTKLRTHRIRTGVAIGISGLMFGLIVTVMVVSQGIYTSIEQFQNEGLNNRTIVNVTHASIGDTFDVYANRADPTFVNEVETVYKQRIAKKQVAAKKYNVVFTPATDDPSPVVYDKELKQKVIGESSFGSVDVQSVVAAKMSQTTAGFDINQYIKPYSHATLIQRLTPIQPTDGQLAYMKNGKEASDEKDKSESSPDLGNVPFGSPDSAPTLQIVESSLAKPFIVGAAREAFNVSKGEIPVILPYSVAEKLLNLKVLGNDATSEQKLARMSEVRQRIGEATASFCYRNAASQSVLAQAKSQQKEIASHKNDTDYQKPKRIYALPDASSCGAVGVSSDTRTTSERKIDDDLQAFQREVGEYIGDPVQYKVTVRGVGVSSDLGTISQAWSMTDMVKELFSSWLGYNTWSIPADMLASLPVASRPTSLFAASNSASGGQDAMAPDSYLVEFSDRQQARELLAKQDFASGTFTIPFGSGTLVVDEARSWVNTVLKWLFVIFGTIAAIILVSIISRTVAEGRRESAVFRAIGASRADIGAVYGMYTLLLSLYVVGFTFLIGIAAALSIEIVTWRDATLGARLAYAASDTNKEFHLFDLSSPFLLWVVLGILVIGVISAILPIMLGARRNPIADMRNDT